MIDYEEKEDCIVCWSYDFEKSDDVILGAIRKDYEGYWVFHPARKVTLNCGQLKRLCKKLSDMNTSK